MRILNLQNAVLVSFAIAGASIAACSSSDATHTDPTAGAPGAGETSGGAGAPATNGGAGNTAGAAPTGAGAGGAPVTGGGAGGGAAAGAAGAPAPSVCDGTGSRVLDATMAADAFIDDFEKVNMNTTTMMDDPAAVGPAWYGFNDVMPTGNAIQPTRAAGGAIATMFAGHYAGTGAKTPVLGGYGVGLEINVGVDKSLMPPQYCVDASAFTGVSFWAKAGSATLNKISAGFVVASQNQQKNGGDCLDTLPAAKCNNYPQKNIVLTTDWAQYSVAFADVTGSTGAKVVGGKVQQILWLAPTADWDFSIDEVAFYTGATPPATPVAPPAM